MYTLTRIKRHPAPFIIALLFLITTAMMAYVGLVNLPKFYSVMSANGITKKQVNEVIGIQSYVLVTVISLFTFLTAKMSELILGIKKRLKGRNILLFVLSIIPSPLYMIVQIEVWMNYSPMLNDLFFTFAAIFLPCCLVSFRKEIFNNFKCKRQKL